MVISLGKSEPETCPFSWQEGTSAGRQVRERDVPGLHYAGRVVEVFVIELPSGRLLFDDGKTGNAVERIGLHSEPGIGDLMTAPEADSVRTCMQRCECLLNPAELLDSEQLDGQSDIVLILRGGLVDRVGEEFGFCGDEM